MKSHGILTVLALIQVSMAATHDTNFDLLSSFISSLFSLVEYKTLALVTDSERLDGKRQEKIVQLAHQTAGNETI